ncbi:MAG: phosphoribosylformylglycinamidine cyclo-ligase [Saprospiraceae bacterium]|nr:phosphoribosylformylglycinamidine cyclo-ligase [Saprospiraceae bacterium]
MSTERYKALGVSADKEDVHRAIRNLDQGLYPRAFCKVLPDWVAGDDDWVNLIHADTAGTKTSLAYLYWRETGDVGVWRNIAQDALVMNLDDLACVGCTRDIVVSSTIGRNRHLIPGEVVEAIIEGNAAFIESMRNSGIRIHAGGGETADVGDIVRSVDVGITAFARMPKSDLLVNAIKPGNAVVGFASAGKTAYENAYNSGIGSNGLTAARHDLLGKQYARIEESYAPQTSKDQVYTGPFALSDTVETAPYGLTVGQLLLSPTRTYLPVLQELLGSYRKYIHGIIHCTGGGQTKVLKFIGNVAVVKDALFDPPPVFQMLIRHSLCSPRELYQVYNMGHRMEMYVDDCAVEGICEMAARFSLEAKRIGYVEESAVPKVIVRSGLGEFEY